MWVLKSKLSTSASSSWIETPWGDSCTPLYILDDATRRWSFPIAFSPFFGRNVIRKTKMARVKVSGLPCCCYSVHLALILAFERDSLLPFHRLCHKSGCFIASSSSSLLLVQNATIPSPSSSSSSPNNEGFFKLPLFYTWWPGFKRKPIQQSGTFWLLWLYNYFPMVTRCSSQ